MITKIEILWNQLRVCGKQTWKEYGIRNCDIELNRDEYRLDDFGAIIKKTEQGNKTEFGWTIDHIFPLTLGGGNDIENLRLLHWRNNEQKADDFPTHSWNTSINFQSNKMENHSLSRIRLTVHKDVVNDLSAIYPEILDHYYFGIRNSGGIYNL